MKKIFFYLHACDLRGLDAKRTIKYFSENNYKLVLNPDDADIIIFFACAVKNNTTDESMRMIKEFQKYDAELIVTGCLPAIEKEKLSKIFSGKTICTKDIEKIDDIFSENRIKYRNINDANIVFRNSYGIKSQLFFRKITKDFRLIERVYLKFGNYVLKNLLGEHSMFYRSTSDISLFLIRISTGCLGNCSYCTIRKAIGPMVSKSQEEIIREFKKGLNNGYEKLIIAGDETGGYGTDINSNFPELLYKLTEIKGDYTISIRNLDPKWIVRYINDLEIILKRKKIRSIETSIQSGSNRILKLMNRYSNIQEIEEVLIQLKSFYPDLSLTTDYILGFPSETIDDFNQTMEFFRRINFSGGMIIPFSCKSGTEAESIEPKITQKEMSCRFRIAKKYLKNLDYHVIYRPRKKYFIFDNRTYRNG
jgi:threonylcarbamoyladenosine tRNA methylthiotransferase MtaB